MSVSKQWQALVRSFPVLSMAGAPSEDPETLDEWAASRPLGEGGQEAVRFCLAVYNHRHTWKAGEFNLFRAIRVWDNGQQAAFARWAAEPFQP